MKRRFSRRKATSIEKAIGSFLRKNNTYYRREFKIDFFHVDFYIPSSNLVIQTDGCYWHFHQCEENAGKIPTGKQLTQMHRDKACNGVMTSRGYKVLRLWECEIINDWEGCEQKILKSLEE